MSLDECVAAGATPSEVARAVRRTTAWAARGRNARTRDDMALFGIVQGASTPSSAA
jgi:queuine tRNA-ribosyltransferase